MAGISIRSSPAPNGPAGFAQLHLEDMVGQEIQGGTSSSLIIGEGGTFLMVDGQGLTYDADGQLTGGTVTGLNLILHGRGVTVNISGINVPGALAYQWVVTGANQAALDYILAGDDTIFGSGGPNAIWGGPGQDRLEGGGGMDRLDGGAGDDFLLATKDLSLVEPISGASTFIGGPGNDVISGDGSSWNTAVFSGNASDYELRFELGQIFVTDKRDASPDGTDRLSGITYLQFAGGQTQFFGPQTPGQAAALGAREILRDPNLTLTATKQWMHNLLPSLTPEQAAILASDQGAATSSVAVLSYQFFTGHAPSAAGMDYLVSPTGPNPNNLNSAYYQSFSLENRYINFAVNLGKLGEGKAAFADEYGSLELFDATKLAYTEIFGSSPSDAKVHALLDPTFTLNGQTMSRAQYFAYYGGDGPNGQGTKAAMVGWLLAEGVKANVGTYALSGEAFFVDTVMEHADYGVDVIGQYGKAEFAYPGS